VSPSIEPNVSLSGLADALGRLATSKDRSAWSILVHQAGPDIRRISRRIIADDDIADDCVQETLLHVREQAGKFKPPMVDADALARRWVMRVAVNVALHVLRGRRRSHHRDNNFAQRRTREAATSDPHVECERSETAAIVRHALSELSQVNSLAVVLHHCAGLSIDEVAAELKVAPETAKKRVHRGVSALRQRLGRCGTMLSVALLIGFLKEAGAQDNLTVGSGAGEASDRLLDLLDKPQYPRSPQTVVPDLGVGSSMTTTKVAALLVIASICGLLAWVWSAREWNRHPEQSSHAIPVAGSDGMTSTERSAVSLSSNFVDVTDAERWHVVGTLQTRSDGHQVWFSTSDRTIDDVGRIPQIAYLDKRLYQMAQRPSIRLEVTLPENGSYVFVIMVVSVNHPANAPNAGRKFELNYNHLITPSGAAPQAYQPFSCLSLLEYDLSGRYSRPLSSQQPQLDAGKHAIELSMSADELRCDIDGTTWHRVPHHRAADEAVTFTFGVLAPQRSESANAEVLVENVAIKPEQSAP
jgi:RNA polymerase sigma-70 factor, ECF subfamily